MASPSRRLIDWPEGLALKSPLSAGWETDGLVILSGQVPLDAGNGMTVSTDFREQTHQVIDNLAATLGVAGLSLADVIRCTAYLTSRDYFRDFNEIYASRFEKPYPARITLIVELANAEYLVEIDAIAVRR